MLRARNDMTHIYDALAARRLVDAVLQRYIPEFQKMKEGIESFYKDEIDNMLKTAVYADKIVCCDFTWNLQIYY